MRPAGPDGGLRSDGSVAMFMQCFLKSPVRILSSADFSERFARDLHVEWVLLGLRNQRKVVCGIVRLVLCALGA